MNWDRSLRDCTLDLVLGALYDHEINCRLESFWDGGWTVSLGDELNGWRTSATFSPAHFHTIPEWLVVNAEAYWPGLLKKPERK